MSLRRLWSKKSLATIIFDGVEIVFCLLLLIRVVVEGRTTRRPLRSSHLRLLLLSRHGQLHRGSSLLWYVFRWFGSTGRRWSLFLHCLLLSGGSILFYGCCRCLGLGCNCLLTQWSFLRISLLLQGQSTGQAVVQRIFLRRIIRFWWWVGTILLFLLISIFITVRSFLCHF